MNTIEQTNICNVGSLFNQYHSLGKFNRRQINDIFLIFPRKIDFDISCKSSPKETICKKCQSLFSWKIRKNVSKCHLLKFFPVCLALKSNHTCQLTAICYQRLCTLLFFLSKCMVTFSFFFIKAHKPQRQKKYLQYDAPSKDSDQPARPPNLNRIFSLGTFWIAKYATFPHADNEDSDQTVQMCRLI